MKKINLLVILLFLLFCAASSGNEQKDGSSPMFMLINNPVSLLEKNIVSNYKYLVSVNKSIGDDMPSVLTGKPQLLKKFKVIIASRFSKDLNNIYQNIELDCAESNYLLLTEENNEYFVRVLRLKDVRKDGKYTALKGLIYHFSSFEDEVIEVYPSHY